MLYTKMTVLPEDKCVERQICAVSLKVRNPSCEDSGADLVIKDKNSGAFTYEEQCTDVISLTFMRIASYVNWIQRNTNYIPH